MIAAFPAVALAVSLTFFTKFALVKARQAKLFAFVMAAVVGRFEPEAIRAEFEVLRECHAREPGKGRDKSNSFHITRLLLKLLRLTSHFPRHMSIPAWL
jgi:hypothetical protein